MDNYIINPTTGRPILFNGAIHRRLLKTNQIQRTSIAQKQTNSIEAEPIKANSTEKKQTNVNLSKKNQSDNDSSDNDEQNNLDLQELFNTLNKNQGF
jgi:hypothetical protein